MQIKQGENLSRVKVTNQNAIRKIIYHYGPVTRQEIARYLNLTMPTITTNINNMIANGILMETDIPDPQPGTLGRRTHLIDLIPQAKYFTGVEVRGTLRRLCVTDYRGKIYYQAKDDTPFTNYEDTVHDAASMITAFFESNTLPAQKIAGIGIGMPGLIDMTQGILDVHPGYGWSNKNVAKDILRLTGYEGPVTIANNVYACARGIQLFQRKQLNNVPSFAYLMISTGIACPMIANNASIVLPEVGMGEVGHMVMNVHGPRCQCGNHGCLEAYSSDLAITARCRERIVTGQAPVLSALCNGEPPTMRQVMTAWKQGEEGIRDIIEEALFYLGLAVANVNNLFRPHTMFIDGMLFSDEQNQRRLLEVAEQNIYHATLKALHIKFPRPDTYNGAKGAAAVAIQKDLETYIP